MGQKKGKNGQVIFFLAKKQVKPHKKIDHKLGSIRAAHPGANPIKIATRNLTLR